MKLSIIIPTYNHLEDCLKPCLESVKEFTDLSDAEVLVVANGCTDGTRAFVEGLGEPFRLIWIDEPAGYTKATNEGIKQAQGEFIVLLNNDTKIIPSPKNLWIDILMEPMSEKNVGITGPCMSIDTDINKNFLIFFCVMIKKKVFETIGLLDEIFSPGFGEDTDFCQRAFEFSYFCRQVPADSVLREADHPEPTLLKEKLLVGNFPMYHSGEGTFGDDDPSYQGIIQKNKAILIARYSDPLPNGFFSAEDINTYREWIEQNVPDGGRIAEIGTWKGRSLCSLADIIKRKNLRVTAVDTFTGTSTTDMEKQMHKDAAFMDLEAIFRENLRIFDIEDNVTVIKGKSPTVGKSMPDNHFDFVFIDADHSYEGCRDDLEAWLPKVKRGGKMAGHDWEWASVKKALQWTFREDQVKSNLGNMWLTHKAKIYDCCMLFNELDILEIRLNELWDVVDNFVIVEATKSHTGVPKPLYLQENWDRFKLYSSKIRYIIVDDFPDTDVWGRERWQRGAMMRGLADAHEEDFVTICDVDEIPSADAIKRYHKGMGITSFDMKLSYYQLNCVANQRWDWAKITTFGILNQLDPGHEAEAKCQPCACRYHLHPDRTHEIPVLENGGWHFSFAGNAEHIKKKIENYSHQEFNTYEIKDQIESRVAAGEDIFGRDIKYGFEEIDDTYPECVKYAYDHLKRKEVLPTVTAIISTKDRYNTTLPLCLMAIANQTVLPDSLIIYDDGEQTDLREVGIYKNIFSVLSRRGVNWEVKFGERKGQVFNHNRSILDVETDFIWRLDDDNVPESDVLGKLLDAMDPEVGAVGGLVLDPKMVRPKPKIASNRIEDIYKGVNIQWFTHEGRSGVDHLYSSFLYRVAASKHGYCLLLSPAGHREETIFTYEMKRAGWKIIVEPSAITWHLQEPEGGIRSHKDPSYWEKDEMVFAERMERWHIEPEEMKLVVLDSGLGDHISFKMILPELKAKYKNICLATCYPDIFKDEGVDQISIADAKAMIDTSEHNIYKFMQDNNWNKSIVDAYRERFL